MIPQSDCEFGDFRLSEIDIMDFNVSFIIPNENKYADFVICGTIILIELVTL